MRKAIEQLIKELRDENDFSDEFYVAYQSGDDISDWHNNHFDDNVELGYSTGQTAAAEDMISKLTAILETK